MKKSLAALLLLSLVVGCVGCGDEPKDDGNPFRNQERNQQGGIVTVEATHIQLSDKDLAFLAKETDLEFLDLTGNNVTNAGLVHLKDLDRLETLVLSHNKGIGMGFVTMGFVTDPSSQITNAGLVHLTGLSNLKRLSLDWCDVTDEELEHLKGLAKLQTLDLAVNTYITDAGLVHLKGLTGLQTLDLRLTKITDAGLVHLKGMIKLQKLNLAFTKVTGAGVADLQKALPNCDIVP
jgi:Leucine-rich repeat (LRR) protein